MSWGPPLPCKQEVENLQIQNFKFRNFKFCVSKLKILRLQTWIYEFLNSNFRLVTKQYVFSGQPYLTAINRFLNEMEEFKGRDIAIS